MCVVSMVMDHFGPKIEPWTTPLPALSISVPLSEIAELRQLLQEFREAVEAAKKVDALTKQPDCVDPEKVKLEERVAALEAVLAKTERSKRRRKS